MSGPTRCGRLTRAWSGIALTLLCVLCLTSLHCVHSERNLPSTAFGAYESAVRHMARSLAGRREQRPALLLSVRSDDPPVEVVSALSDLGVLLYSRAKVQEGPTPEPLVTEPLSGQPGLIVQIRGWTVSSGGVIIFKVVYGVTHSLLTMTLVGDRWEVTHEELLEGIVACRTECAHLQRRLTRPCSGPASVWPPGELRG